MDSQLVTLQEVDGTLAAQWQQLEDVAQTRNPFYGHDYLRAAATWLPDAQAMQLLVGQDAGGLAWLIPLAPSRRLGKAPVVRGLRNRWPHVFFGHPLVAPGRERAAAAALLRHLSGRRGAHWLRLQDLGAEHAFTRALLEEVPATAVHVESYSRGFAVKRAEPTYLEGHSNLRRLQRQRRAFEKKTGEVIELVDRSDDPSALEEFMRLEAAGWKGRQGGAFLTHAYDAAFLREVGAGFRQRGMLRLWCLQSGGETLAMKLNLVAADTVFCYLIAYDENTAALSPGLQLEVENFQLFHADPTAQYMDSCAAPDNEFANRLYPERRELLNVTIGDGVLGRAVTALASFSRP